MPGFFFFSLSPSFSSGVCCLICLQLSHPSMCNHPRLARPAIHPYCPTPFSATPCSAVCASCSSCFRSALLAPSVSTPLFPLSLCLLTRVVRFLDFCVRVCICVYVCTTDVRVAFCHSCKRPPIPRPSKAEQSGHTGREGNEAANATWGIPR